MNSQLIKAVDATIENLKFEAKDPNDRFRINAYKKLRSLIIAHDKPIVAGEELLVYPGVGEKLAAHVNEWLSNGSVKISPNVVAFKKLSKIVDIGPKLAKELVQAGIKTIKQLKEQKKFKLTDGMKLGIKYANDLEHRVPRAEIEQVEQIIKKVCDPIVVTICGSYRRGLPDSGDIDVLLCDLTLATEEDVKQSNVLKQVVKKLHEVNLLIDDLTKDKITTKYMGFCRLGKNYARKIDTNGVSSQTPARRIDTNEMSSSYARRIDLRLIPIVSFFPALVYFTGSYEFNTMMRSIAKRQGYKLNEYGLFHKLSGQQIDVESEEHLFKLLGMKWVDPIDR